MNKLHFLIILPLMLVGALIFGAPKAHAAVDFPPDTPTECKTLLDSIIQRNSWNDDIHYIVGYNVFNGNNQYFAVGFEDTTSYLCYIYFNSNGNDGNIYFDFSGDYTVCATDLGSPAFYDYNGTSYSFNYGLFPFYLYTNFSIEELNISDTSKCVINIFETESTVHGATDLGLLSALYTITFTPEYASNSSSTAQSCIGNSYPVVLNSVRSDNGYNMLSLTCMPLAVSQDTVFYGTYTFHLGQQTTYNIDDFVLSFATDIPISQPDEPEFYIPDDNYFNVHLLDYPPDGTTLSNPVSMTVNNLVFVNGSNSVVTYNNRSLTAFDYRSNSSGYPVISFKACCNANMYSCGSFVYNFSYTDITDNNDPVDIVDLSKQGRDKNDDTRYSSAYVPKYIDLDRLPADFDFTDLGSYDFSSVSDILAWFFRNPFIIAIVTACCIVGLIGYVLFGKR